MKSIVVEKPTVDEAVKQALTDLAVEINEVDIEILKEPAKGLLSFIGSKTAKVKVTVTNGPEEKAKAFIDTVLGKMNIESKYDIKLTGNLLNVNITEIDENDKGIVIGKRGKNLDELQFLLSLIVNKNRDNYIKTVINVEDYREKREQTLQRLAKKMAEKCRRYDHKVKLEPMNPYERRIIHSTLQDEVDILTYSEGDEPYRRVVIDKK